MHVGLRNNNFTKVGSGMFNGSTVTSIDLSHNRITFISENAFNYTLELRTLDLSCNNITVSQVNLRQHVLLLFAVIHITVAPTPHCNFGYA
jgi:Leucine-rich repeat (LRR) protein